MSGLAYEQLTLFPVGSPVSLSLLPGSERAKMMTVTSGRKCSGLYGRSDPLGSLVKMCLESSIWHSTRCFLTWKAKGLSHNRLLFQLAVSMPHTDETESAFWPSITSNGMGCTGHRNMLQKLVDKGFISQEERRQMLMGNGGKINPEWAEWLMGYRKAFTQLLPTPLNTTYKGASLKRFVGGGVLRWEPPRTAGMQSPWQNWMDEPGVPRVVDGISNRVDRIKSLGNAVVPQQFYIFFKLIADIEGADA